MYAIVDKKNNDRVCEHASGQLLVFLTFEDAQARYDKSGFAEFSKNDGTVDWQIAPVMVQKAMAYLLGVEKEIQ